MPKYYAMADAMMVTMFPDPFVSLTLPAKVQSYMAAGKPIIASADGEIRNVIEEAECGFCAKAGDERNLVEKIETFIQSSNRVEYGEKARKYYMNHFNTKNIMDKLEGILENSCV